MITTPKKLICGSILLAASSIPVSIAIGQHAPPVLHADSHTSSTVYQTVFTEPVIPLDTRLPWKTRFNGDERFNSAHSLPTPEPLLMIEVPTKPSGSGSDARGVIKNLRVDQGKIKIQHGPVEKYGMPAMTMLFTARDPALLQGLTVGDEIGFNIDNDSGGFVVTHLTTASRQSDARGIVKLIRAEQGKIKIQHGPVEKYGMPAMTMMFQVSDPALLEGVQQGTEIDFDIDNSAGGFVITNIATPTANAEEKP